MNTGVAITVLNPGPIPHAEIERYADPDVETALEQQGVDPKTATYRLIEVTLDELEDVHWFPGPNPWGRAMIDALTACETFPPVVVMRTDRGRGLGLVDGLNRTHAHWALARPTIRAYELLL